MIAIELKFLTGKYHATPWGRQVNEGAVEWPPSPWRILRTLIATWYYKFPDVPEKQMRDLVDSLSSPPSYRLPPHGDGHTRHYMPATGDAKTKIFDTFLSINPCEPLLICWPQANLRPDQIELLTQLAQSINYFGRAESWVEAHVSDVSDDCCDTIPLDESGVGEDQELVRILSMANCESFQRWRESALIGLSDQKLKEEKQKAIAKGKPADKIKLTAKSIAAIESSLPQETFTALQCDTNELRKAGWNRPPASEWVDYVRPLQKSQSATSHLKHNSRLPTVARFAVASAVVPRLTDAILIGERLRQYLMGISGKRNNGQCSIVFSGKNQDGSRVMEHSVRHGHAHYLSESYGLNSRGRITHVLVFAPAGFDAEDQAALSALRFVYGTGGHDLQLVLLGMGTPSDFGGTNVKAGQSPTLATSRVWKSRTPFVATDHLRIRNAERRAPDSFSQATHRELTRLVRKELSRRPWLTEHAEQVEVDVVHNTHLGGTETGWLKFRRQRTRGGGHCSSTSGYGFRLRFPEPVGGPIALGYGCHFGLGLFEADDSETA